MRIVNRIRTGAGAAALAVVMLAWCAGPAAAVSVRQGSLVTANPADFTPQVLDGSVDALVQVGSRMIAGGTFHTVQTSAGTVTRTGLLAFDARTGVLDSGFAPSLDGPVEALDSDGTSIFAVGDFNTVDGQPARKIAKLTPAGGLAPGFGASADLPVHDVVVRGSRVYVGGAFTQVGNPRVPRAALAALDARTGAALGELDLAVAGQNHGGHTAVRKLDVTTDGRTMVAVGNFTVVAGKPRRQIAMVDLAGGAARLRDWATGRYGDVCKDNYDSYLRDLDIAPDGRFVVVTTTGGYARGTLCDTVTRWEIGPQTTSAEPTWVDATGGDTTQGVSVTGPAAYVGGHQRWLNNPDGDNAAGPGAVSREGIAALDTLNGLPLSWDPGRTRGVGAQAVLATGAGVWVGSDTDKIGRPRETHARIAFFPLAGGTPLPSTPLPTLPANIYQVLPGRLTTRPVGPSGQPRGAPATVPAGAVDWSRVRGAFRVAGTLYYGGPDGFTARAFDPTTGRVGPPRAVDLHDSPGGARISFPVEQLSGAFLDPATHRLYYTLRGRSQLYYRYFTPESQVVGAQSFVVSSGGADLSTAAGLTLAGNRVYYGSADGRLRSIGFSAGRGLTGSPAVVSSDGTWNGSGLFVGPAPRH